MQMRYTFHWRAVVCNVSLQARLIDWGLRDYGIAGQLGLESTPEEYITNMISVFREVWRVMRPDATLWLNIGDCYAGAPNGRSAADTKALGDDDRTFRDKPFSTVTVKSKRLPRGNGRWGGGNNHAIGLKPKDLVMMPFRLALALQADGWWVRSDIIWAKPNPMPESIQGSHFTRHRVTIEEYERLSRLRKEQRRNKDGASDLPDLSAGEVSNSQTSLSAQREGTGDGAREGTTSGRKGKAQTIESFQAGAIEQVQIRSNGKGKGNQGKGNSEIQEQRARQTKITRTLSKDKRPSVSNSPETEGKRTLSENGKVEGKEAARLRSEAGGGNSVSNCDSRGLARDSGATQKPMSLLWQAESPDDGSRHSIEQGREACEGEYSSGLQELQLEEGEQVDDATLVDCPGCKECERTDGYIRVRAAGRPTKSHEYIFLLTKSPFYYYDSIAIQEQTQSNGGGGYSKRYAEAQPAHGGESERHDTGYRNRRTVWTIATESFSGAHFATFPQKLVEPMVLAGSSPQACETCGAPWERMTESKTEYDHITTDAGKSKNGPYSSQTGNGEGTHDIRHGIYSKVTTLGWRPTCACPPERNTGAGRCIVLDPFAGTCTAGKVAVRYGRRFVGLELKPEYIELARERTDRTQMVMQV